MADNMIELVAQLNEEESLKVIGGQLETISAKLSEAQKLKVSCVLDAGGIKNLQAQISKLSKDLSINVNAPSPVKIDTIVDTKKQKSQAQQLIEEMDLKLPRTPKGETARVRKEIQSLIDEYNKFAQVGDLKGADQTFAKLVEYTEQFRKEITEVNAELRDTQSKIKEVARQGQVYINDTIGADLDKIFGDRKTANNELSRLFGVGRWTRNSETLGTTGWDVKAKDIYEQTGEKFEENADGIISLIEYLNKSFDKGEEFVHHYGETIDQEFGDTLRSKLETILGILQVANGEFVELDTGAVDGAVSKVEQLNTAITSVSSAPLGDGVEHLVDNVEEEVSRLKQSLAQEFGVDINKIITNTVKNAKGQISSFSFDITKLNGEIEKFNYKVARNTDKTTGETTTTVRASTIRDSDRGAIELLRRQEAQVDSLTRKLEKLRAGFENANAPRPIRSEDSLSQLEEEFTETDRLIKQIKKSTSQTFDEMVAGANKAINKYEILGKTLRDAENTATDLASNDIPAGKSKLGSQIDGLIKDIITSPISDADTGNLIRQANQIKQSLDSIGDSQGLKIAHDDLTKLKGSFKSLDSQAKIGTFLEKVEDKAVSLDNRIRKLRADIENFAVKNPRAVQSDTLTSSGKTFAESYAELERMAQGANLTEAQVKHLREELQILGKEATNAGEAGKSAFGKFLESFKTMSSYITANMVFNYVKREIREMVNEVITIDTAMTELRKVTEATNEEFAAFAKSAGKTGRELGASISDVINATSTFSRAGFNLKDAEELGRVATLYKNVGDGIDIDGASESIISVMKAFNMEASEAERVIDRINKVSNNFAIDSQGLGFALQRVASAMDAANNSLDETIALTTVSNEIVQNPEMVAQGWRTVALRIRGAKTELEDAGLETEGMVESTAKLRDLIKQISGVDIMLDDSTFKSTYQIIEEIGKAWKDISDVNQAALLEAIAGKRQSNIVAAALNNYERLDDVLQKSINSTGSAMREQEEYAKSIQYSLSTFKAAFQDLAQTTITPEFITGLVGAAQSFLEVLTKIVGKIGAIPAILAAITTINAIRGKGKPKNMPIYAPLQLCA